MCLRFWIKQHTKEINICRKREKQPQTAMVDGGGRWCDAAVDVEIGPELISNWALRLG